MIALLLLALPQDPVPTVTPGIVTDRESAISLELPSEADSYQFAVFGDRTGGPPEGVSVLRQAVKDVNLVEPDLVMTVGDLIQGYNQTAGWMPQMREFKGIMNKLLCPWFPVAGNHDIYWRGENRPPEEHEASYEEHFGPLWYAFRHKRSWFFVLYTDEANPETGERNFSKAESQRMSPEQYSWLDETLKLTTDAEHVFVFLHHPRWIGGNYGDDWERVHQRLVQAGNVNAVFAGHIHRMRYDGPRDGIEYFALATVGGGQSGLVPEAGYLHHYYLVTVRKGRVAVVNYPVGSASDPRLVTGEVSGECGSLAKKLAPKDAEPLPYDPSKGALAAHELSWTNPVSHPVELTWLAEPDDARWQMLPDHHHMVVAPGETITRTFQVMRRPGGLDAAFQIPSVRVHADYLGSDLRVSIPTKSFPLKLALSGLSAPDKPDQEQVLALDGKSAHISIPSAQIELPDGPFTIEAWMRAESFGGRMGLVTKTESSEYGLFVSDGSVNFSIHLDGKYITPNVPTGTLAAGRWYHLAGVFDGEQARLFIDGKQVANLSASGKRTLSELPLIVGGDVNNKGAASSFFHGDIDELRITRKALYDGKSFTPKRRLNADRHTALLLHFDGPQGPWVHDAAQSAPSPMLRAGARILTRD
ncbi:MAG: hypothetical protein ACI9HE_001268 [Planctomycetota bacterium]|jgi:hypothetical protein